MGAKTWALSAGKSLVSFSRRNMEDCRISMVGGKGLKSRGVVVPGEGTGAAREAAAVELFRGEALVGT